MRIPACLGALVRSPCRAGSGILHRYIHRQGQRPLTTLNLFARSCSLHRVVRPHTTSHAASRAASVRLFLAQLCNTRVETRAVLARVKRAKRDPLDVIPLLQPRLLRDAVAKHYRTCARVGAEKWLSNGARTRCFTCISVLRNPRGRDECRKAAVASRQSPGLLIK